MNEFFFKADDKDDQTIDEAVLRETTFQAQITNSATVTYSYNDGRTTATQSTP